nr:Lrp/AsnC ligand binding domain-containing protein [Natronomonas gomsonensis]
MAVDLDAIDDVTARLRERPEFVTVYQMSGPSTVFAVGKFEDDAALAAQLHDLHDDPDVRTVDTSSVRSVVREGDPPALED